MMIPIQNRNKLLCILGPCFAVGEASLYFVHGVEVIQIIRDAVRSPKPSIGRYSSRSNTASRRMVADIYFTLRFGDCDTLFCWVHKNQKLRKRTSHGWATGVSSSIA